MIKKHAVVYNLLHYPPVFRWLFFVSYLLFPVFAIAQAGDGSIDISLEKKYVTIKTPPVVFVSPETDLVKSYASLADAFKPLHGASVSARKITSKVITRFRLINTANQAVSCYFFPGFFFSNVNLYKVGKNNQIQQLPSEAPRHKDSVSFRKITLAAGDSATLLAECYQVKSYVTFLRPKIIHGDYIFAYIFELQGESKTLALFNYIFCGLLIMMILFSMANFWLGRKVEFLFYSLYAFSLAYMVFTKQFYFQRSNFRNFFYEEYLDFFLQGAGISFYFAFFINFLETRKKHPFLHRLYVFGIGFLVIILTLYTYLHYGTQNYFAEQLLENYVSKVVLLLMLVIFLIYALKKWDQPLFRILFWGNLLFLIFSLISLAIVIRPEIPRLPGLLGNSLVLYEIGLLMELIFFLVALTYKNRIQLIDKVMESERLKLENERKELEKQMAVMAAQQKERERISADMHDELGSGMTTIRLMSEIAKNKLKDNIPVEIEKISSSANDLLNKMNAIIWSMNSSNDSVDNLVSYIRSYATEYLDGTSIQCKIYTPEAIPHIEISGDKRRNIFLCLKETLNNALKHSQATEMMIHIEITHKLLIQIKDNGIGIDPDKTPQFSNGLRNIEYRMRAIGGTFSLNTDNGTLTRLELPL